MRRYLQAIAQHYGLENEQIRSIDFDLLESRINEYFSRAHLFYQNAVKDSQMDYGIYHNAFFELLKMVEQRGCIKDDLISQFAYGIVKHALTVREDKARIYFEANPVGDDYCGLLKVILGDKYISDQSGRDDKRLTNINSVQSVAKQAYTPYNDESSQHCSCCQDRILLQSSVSDKTIASMAQFANNEKLFNRRLSMEDLKDFFYNKKEICLKMTRNNHVAFFFQQLSQRSFIKNDWANIIACNRMLISSSGSVIVDAHNLTVAACKIANKPIDALKDKERLIYNFVSSLKFD